MKHNIATFIGHNKAVLRQKFIGLNSYLKETKFFKKYFNLTHPESRKERVNEAIVIIWKEIMHIESDINFKKRRLCTQHRST